VSDPVTLLDDEQVHQAGERVPEQAQVFRPVARGERQRPHLVQGQGQRGPISLARRGPQLGQNARARES
jgi:hypothetical protein